ncbi:MAG: hypothetical protein CVV27_17065 [Candidatus Melainabacteria bacterium HGW-Melainabacteria-1]|nr:MAG: hypothetical protein CVV27_17065 [Candidatus Melainabacteria bacterium HGW-Melainabacteria-1]
MGRKRIKIIQATAFGEKLQTLRLKRGLSREALGLSAGVSATYIGMLESGQRQPSRDLVLRFGQSFYPQGHAGGPDELLLLAGFSPLQTRPAPQQDLLEIYTQAVAEDPYDFKAFVSLILALIKNGDHMAAQLKLQEGFGQFDAHLQLQCLLALLELSKGRTDDAVNTMELVLRQYRAHPEREQGVRQADLLLNLGSMYFIKACEMDRETGKKDLKQACRLLQEAASIAPHDVYILDEYARASFNLAAILSGHAADAQWRETVSSFRAVLALDDRKQLGAPLLREATVFLGLAYAKSGQLDAAELSLQIIGALSPDYWLLNYVEACRLCLAHAREPCDTLLQRAMVSLALAAESMDPQNRTHSEAPLDPDLAPLRTRFPEQFTLMLKSPSQSKTNQEIPT